MYASIRLVFAGVQSQSCVASGQAGGKLMLQFLFSLQLLLLMLFINLQLCVEFLCSVATVAAAKDLTTPLQLL